MGIPLSVLDIVPVPSGATPERALSNARELARHAENLGYVRYWLAEHHGMPSVASSAPEILIEHLASCTTRIRVGSGGMMLPHHAPLRVAEAFHTLAGLHPGRIDLGVGRAPVTDPGLVAALRPNDPEEFPRQLSELMMLSRRAFGEQHPLGTVHVVPAGVPLPPVWVLGSRGGGARLAGEMGLGYAFASHFTHTPPGPAFEEYRQAFRPSSAFPRPHAILTVSVVAAETQEEADYLASSMRLWWVQLQQGCMLPLPSPEEAVAYPYSAQERAVADAHRRLQIVGTPQAVGDHIRGLIIETAADEVMIRTVVHSHQERLRSYELLAEALGS